MHHCAGRCRVRLRDLEILKAIDVRHTFFRAQYTEVLVSVAAGLGWVDWPLALRRHQGVNKVGGSIKHSVTEILIMRGARRMLRTVTKLPLNFD